MASKNPATSPSLHRGRVLAILTGAQTGTNLNMLTEGEQQSAFALVCRQTNSELIFAARSHGQKTDTNSFSFSRATITYSADLMAYSCGQSRIVWRDQIILSVALGEGNVPTSEELNNIAADAWAERILQASGYAPYRPQVENRN
jgi:hypothetical protein